MKRADDWGPDGLEKRVADAWQPFCKWISGWLEVESGHGFEAVKSAYMDVLEGRIDPKTARVITL